VKQETKIPRNALRAEAVRRQPAEKVEAPAFKLREEVTAISRLFYFVYCSLKHGEGFFNLRFSNTLQQRKFSICLQYREKLQRCKKVTENLILCFYNKNREKRKKGWGERLA
jgi:hypothetical protein